jgi:hypothetical protein
MGINPPSSMIDPPIVVSDNVWPLAQYTICAESGIEEAHQHIVSDVLSSVANRVFVASGAVKASDSEIKIRSSDANYAVWLAPAGTTNFTEGATMTQAPGSDTAIAIPTQPGNYKLHVLDAQGMKLDESEALLRVEM